MLEVIIPVSDKHLQQMDLTFPFLKNLNYDKLTIIGNQNVKNHIEVKSYECQFIYENDLIDMEKLKHQFTIRRFTPERTGWYLQQFIKMKYSLITESDYYVSWDIDTIPLKPIRFVKDGKYLMNFKNEHHEPYFNCIKKMLGNNITIANHSFISEYMAFDTKCMRELIAKLGGEDGFIRRVFSCMDTDHITRSGFSEFETYGTYMWNFHRDRIEQAHLKTNRFGMHKYGRIPDIQSINESELDTISFENWDS